MKGKLSTITAIGSLLLSSPAIASISCETSSFMHVKLTREEKKNIKVNRTLRAFDLFADSKDWDNSEIVESWAVINGERFDCKTSEKTIAAKCGPITLASIQKDNLTVPRPLLSAYPFDYAEYNSENYATIDNYAVIQRFNKFEMNNYNENNPDYLAPSNIKSISHCKSREELKNDPNFAWLTGWKGYMQKYNGKVCIEEVKCSKTSATTLLSLDISLLPLKYKTFLDGLKRDFDSGDKLSEVKEYLTKVNPLLKRDDLINVKFKIKISSPMVTYISPL